MNETLDYYDKNAEAFANGTADIEFSEVQDLFLSKLNEGASILDFGCGSGRDAWYMVAEYHLNLGPRDNLEFAVNRLVEISGFKTSEDKAVLLEYIRNCQDPEVLRYKRRDTLPQSDREKHILKSVMNALDDFNRRYVGKENGSITHSLMRSKKPSCFQKYLNSMCCKWRLNGIILSQQQ